MSCPWAELMDSFYHKETTSFPSSLPLGIATHFNGLAGDTHLIRGELIQGVKPTESVHSSTELLFCRISSLRDLTGSLRVCELAQKKREAGGGDRKLNRSF